MKFYDEQILEAKMELERQAHTTLTTGIYAEDELITFTRITIPDTSIHIMIPDRFVIMPQSIKDLKYPSKNAPDYIITSVDSTVNFGFNELPVLLEQGDIVELSTQFQNAIKSTNPSIVIKRRDNLTTDCGNEISWFEFKGYALDGQNYNRMCLVRMRKSVLHGIFNCPNEVKSQWNPIAEQIFRSVEETL